MIPIVKSLTYNTDVSDIHTVILNEMMNSEKSAPKFGQEPEKSGRAYDDIAKSNSTMHQNMTLAHGTDYAFNKLVVAK